MRESPSDDAPVLSVHLDAKTYIALQQTATERDLAPAELVERWVRERLAHEAERKQGRARTQRES